MKMITKHELTQKVLERYLKASRKEKTRILDEYCATAGYNRKYAIWKLSDYQLHERDRPKKVIRARKYGLDVQQALIKIWKICDCICSTRLRPYLPEIVSVLKRHGEIHLSAQTEAKLLVVSRATIDRMLREARRNDGSKIRGTTRPGSLLKREIPLRIGAWREASAGFGEIDLVAHCGETTAGQYVNTLNYTDIETTWSEREAVLGKAQGRVFKALQNISNRLPFPLRGIDSDNDSVFINAHMVKYCHREQIVFTRSRPYKKNDNAHVEQKNWTTVRKIFGYIRMELQQQAGMMNELYRGPLRDYTNFFQPTQKCQEKKRVGARKVKKYDTAKTPYKRVLESKDVSQEVKEKLKNYYKNLNPVNLRKEIEKSLNKIYDLSQKYIPECESLNRDDIMAAL
jgi:hypothetical protein